jgi:hypothetical protein
VVLDEFYQSGSHVEDVIRWLDRENKPDGTIYAEHVPAEIQKFERSGWTVEKADKDIDAGIAEVRRRLDTDGNMEVEESKKPAPTWGWSGEFDTTTGKFVTSGGRESAESPDREHGSHVGLLVADSCESLVREFLGYKEEHVGKGAATDHALDSLRYAVMGASGGTKAVVERTARSSASHQSRIA